MPMFQKRPVVIEAIQWWKHGDHPMVKEIPAWKETDSEKGWVITPEGGVTVTPGDWIIEGTAGEFYPCKPEIFEQVYEKPTPKWSTDKIEVKVDHE